MRTFSGFSPEFVWDGLPMIQGMAFYSWAMENDAMNQFGGITRVSPGYVKQESQKLVEEAHRVWAQS